MALTSSISSRQIFASSGPRQRVEDDDVVDAVDELGREVAPQLLQDQVLDLLVALDAPGCRRSPRGVRLTRCFVPMFEVMMISVFLKSTDVAVGVRQDAVLEDLQEEVRDVRVRLLDLVEAGSRCRDCGGSAP